MTVETFVFPTSFAQRRLWFIAQLEPDSTFYNISMRLALSGSLDVGALERAVAAVVDRHESLRTTFSVVDGEPVQVIVPRLAFELPVVDLSSLPADRREAEVSRHTTAEVGRPFDLEAGPLVRVRLLRLQPEEHVLLLVLHHIVFDGWSSGVLHRELSECYRAFAVDESPRLPELAVQYADYAVWQRQWLQGETFERQIAYWKNHLAGAAGVVEVPSDFAPRPRRSYQGAAEQALFPLELLHGLKALSQQEGATLFMTLLAGFKTLLMRYSGQRDIIVGSPIANRARSELEQLIGFFVNSLALRTDLSGDPSFRALLRRVREVALGAYSHQDLPFEKVVEELQPDRLQDRNPIFQVMFALQNAPRAPLTLPGITIRTLPRRRRTAKFDLTLFAMEQSRGLSATLEYSTDLFRADTVARMLGHYRRLLEAAVADPDRRVSDLPLLTDEERRHIVVDWNSTDRSFPRDRGVHRLFEAQAAERPNAIAVEDGAGRLTYDELNRRANRLARRLRGLGIGPEARVGIAVERSADLVVSLLAVLKAGGAYVPLDSSYPAERLAFMVKDARIGVLLTRGSSRVPAGGEVPSLDLERDHDAILRESQENLEGDVPAARLAYLMYTSGSTGTPKGIAIPHEAILRLVCNTDYIRLTPADRVAQVSNASFDAATFEIWGALLHGGRLLIVSREISLAPARLAAEIRQRGVTTMFLTTALFNQIARTVPGAFRSVRHVLFGGEAVDPVLVRDVLRDGPPERLLHVYGPTETTTFATWHEVKEVGDDAVTVPIGAPIANTRAYVLDGRLRPVPVGVPGELYLGGPGLARGYLGRPALTAERFVPDPFGTEAGGGERLYRTGDRVRRLSDGAIEFLGRLDGQIKLRGFRIEPGEIEAMLVRHPKVGECSVVLRDDVPGGPALVAYLTGSGPAALGVAAEARAYLRDRLPAFMIPAQFVVLDALPLSPNGKVDRRALPPPSGSRPELEVAFAAPHTDTERSLATLWQDLLGVERVGREDNFFELGGHSLLAVTLFADIERVFGVRLPLAALFQAPTLDRLATEIEQARRAPSSVPRALVALQPKGHRPPLILAHGGWGDLFFYRHLVARLGPDQPIFGFESPVEPDGAAAVRTVESLAAEYVRELRAFQREGPYFLCGYCWAGGLTFEMACQLRSAGQEVALLALIDSPCPGYKRAGPVPSRSKSRARDYAGRIWRNLLHLRKLRPGAMPAFLGAKIGNFAMRVAGGAAFRLSLRLGRAALPGLRTRSGVLLQAGKLYRPQSYPGRLTLFRAKGNSTVERSLYWGWDQVAAGGVELCVVEGGHDSMLEEPHVTGLAAMLRDHLERAQASAS